MLRRLVVACASAALCACAGTVQAPTRSGPQNGALFIAGGGALDATLVARFVQLAGGPDARIVIVPTASTEDSFPATWPGYRIFEQSGVRSVSVLHTRSRAEADSETFTAPLRSATAVWLPGGRQWRLTDAYLGTRTQREIEAVLRRGGVVGGTSAGASVQASYMVRGSPESNTVMMAAGHEDGFGLLRDAAIDQHLTARGRQDDMLAVIAAHPGLLGIGIDEGTALIVRGDRAEIAGRGRVAFYNAADRDTLPYYFLGAGDSFDLASRTTERGTRLAPQIIRTEAEIIAVVDRLFDAMRTRDTTVIRRLLHPQIRVFVPLERDGTTQLRISGADDFVTQIATARDTLNERAFRPIARVDGPLGIVWTYYEFTIGSTFSHCGTDAFQMLRTSAGWVITGLAYTVRREGCTRD